MKLACVGLVRGSIIFVNPAHILRVEDGPQTETKLSTCYMRFLEPTNRLTPELADLERWENDGGYTDWYVEAIARADDLWEFFRDVPTEEGGC